MLHLVVGQHVCGLITAVMPGQAGQCLEDKQCVQQVNIREGNSMLKCHSAAL